MNQERKNYFVIESDRESDSSDDLSFDFARDLYKSPGKQYSLTNLVGSVAFGLPTLAVTRRSLMAND